MAYSTFYNVNDATERISHLAAQQKEFLFVANFECTEFIIAEEPRHQTDILFDIPSASNVNKDLFQGNNCRKRMISTHQKRGYPFTFPTLYPNGNANLVILIIFFTKSVRFLTKRLSFEFKTHTCMHQAVKYSVCSRAVSLHDIIPI